MKDLLKKAVELVEMLEEENAVTKALGKQLSAKKADWDEIDRKHQAADNQLAARERVVCKLEAFSKEKAVHEENVKKYNEDKKKLAERIEENMKKTKELDKAMKEATDKEALFTKKSAILEAEKAEIARKEKIKAEILTELRKGL